MAFFAIFGTYALGKLGWIEDDALILSTPTPPQQMAAPKPDTEPPMRFTDRIAARGG
jgi:hypothetical protein